MQGEALVWSRLQRRIEQMVDAFPGVAGVAVAGLDGGAGHGQPLWARRLLGVEMMMAMSQSGDSSQSREIAQTLGRYLKRNINEITSLSMGWESDVYGFTVVNQASGQTQERVLRLYFGAHSAYTAQREAAALRLLRHAGYPVPEVYTVETGTAALGRPFLIMARAPGELLWPLMLRPDVPEADRHLEVFSRLLARLHGFGWQALPAADLAWLPRRDCIAQLDFLGGFLDRYPLDGFGAGMEWLRARQTSVAPLPLGMLHWDFHPANVLYAPPDRYTVIDWTQAEVSDPRFDLAWTLIVVGSQASWPAAESIQAGYAAQGGRVDGDLDFFMAAACLKRLYSVLLSLSHGAELLGMRPHAETIMAGQLERIAQVYGRWLELTGLRMAEADRRLAAYL